MSMPTTRTSFSTEKRLGAVVAETADRFGTPLAVPLMDLTLEKQAMLLALGVHEGQVESYHLSMPIQDRPEFIPHSTHAGHL